MRDDLARDLGDHHGHLAGHEVFLHAGTVLRGHAGVVHARAHAGPTEGLGGALHLESDNQFDPFADNVTITRTTFANNHADTAGDDIFIRRDALGAASCPAVPCPAPGKACKAASGDATPCCFDFDGEESPTLTLPSN